MKILDIDNAILNIDLKCVNILYIASGNIWIYNDDKNQSKFDLVAYQNCKQQNCLNVFHSQSNVPR